MEVFAGMEEFAVVEEFGSFDSVDGQFVRNVYLLN